VETDEPLKEEAPFMGLKYSHFFGDKDRDQVCCIPLLLPLHTHRQNLGHLTQEKPSQAMPDRY
jgi:hypothetical protein